MIRLIKLAFVAVMYVCFIVVMLTALTQSGSGDTKNKNETFDMLIRDLVVTQIVPMVRHEFTINKDMRDAENSNMTR
jgi:hypothetical protein